MHSIGRLIDANANRASEAARTLEDIARFLLDDQPAAAAFKAIRHEIAACLDQAGWSRPPRARSRETERDVGTELSARDPHRRADVLGIASAAGGRLTEAVRCLEEACKLREPVAARALEAIRYRCYTAERDVIRRLEKPSAEWPLCVLVTESGCAGRDWLDVAARAIRGGAACIQLREKHLSDGELLKRARRLVALCREHGAAAIVNDRPDITLLAEADGVHLGQTDLSVPDARLIVGERTLIGVSCSSRAHADAAARAGADYLGLGPVYRSGTKPKPSLAGERLIEAIAADAELARLPHLAISGIDATNAGSLGRIGCRGLAVSSAVCAADDPADAARRVLASFEAGRRASPDHDHSGDTPCPAPSSSTPSATA